MKDCDNQMVLMAYKLILGREPENDAVLQRHFANVEDLRRFFLCSPEFINSSIANEIHLAREGGGYHLSLSPPNVGFNQIKTFEQYDDFIKSAIQANLDPQMLSTYKLDFEEFVKLYGTSPPCCDPFSDEYRDWELSFFQFLSGQEYCVEKEGQHFNVELEKLKPPTLGQSIDKRAESNHNYMEMLKRTRLKRGLRVLEMGFGHGNLLELLGRTGFQVSGIDASKEFVEYSKWRLESQNINANLICGSFYDVGNFDDLFDVVIFESSFHHCGDPVRLFNKLNTKLASKGRVIFLRDGIYFNADRPWGVICHDGASIFQIRHRGWMELGYRRDFFEELLKRTGFKLCGVYPMSNGIALYEAVKV